MSSYQYDSLVSRAEADALKEMIFRRARERAVALNNETQESYTDSVRNDIMNVARESFTASNNPFSIQQSEAVKTENKTEPKEIEAAKVRIEEIKSQIVYRQNSLNKNATDKAAIEAMDDARNSLSNNKGFTGALEFLNSQASISLISKKGEKFNAIA